MPGRSKATLCEVIMSALHWVIKRFHEGFRYFLIKNGTCIDLGERNFVLYR